MSSQLEADALSAASVLSRRNEFVRYVLETKLPGVHYHHADKDEENGIVCSTSTAVGPLISNAGHPTIKEENSYIGEPNFVTGGIFHSESLEYLEKYGPFLLKNLKEVEKNCSMLLNIADSLKVLSPPDDPVPWDILNMAKWKASLSELIKELKTVEEKCPSLILNTSVYVLTTSPYDAFLRALAAEIADAAEKITQFGTNFR